MPKIERFIKTAGVYFLGNVFTKLLSFLLLPLYTNKILPDKFGEYGLVLSITNLIIPLFFFQIWDSVFRYSFDYQEDDSKYKVISNGFIIMILGIFTYSIGFWILTSYVILNYKFLVFLYSIGIGFQYFYSVVARSLYKNSLFVISGCFNSGIMLFINVILIVFFNRDIDALYLSATIGILIQIIIIESKVKPLRKFRLKDIEFRLIKDFIYFSFPLSLSTMTHWLLNGFTQLAISVQIGPYANGLFTVVNKFSTMLVLLVKIFQFAWNEMAYILSNDKNKNYYYKKSVTEILKISILGTSIFILIVKLIFPYFVGSEYQNALNLVPIVMVGTMFNVYSGFLGTIFLANKNSNKLFVTTLISSVLNVVGLFILIPRWGLLGAVISLCFAFIVGAGTRTIMMSKTEKISLDKSSYYPLLQLGFSMVIFYYVENTLMLILLIALNILFSIIWLRGIIAILFKIIKDNSKKFFSKFM